MGSGHQAETLFERVNDGYAELTEEIKGLSNVEKVLLDTADSVMDTKKKLEFGVQQIIFKVGELVEVSGGQMDDQLKDQFADITRTILSNQTEALANLTKKVEKEIGQVWRQMGIMYGQVSNSISILEKVKFQTEGYVNNTGKNLELCTAKSPILFRYWKKSSSRLKDMSIIPAKIWSYVRPSLQFYFDIGKSQVPD